MRGSIMIEHFKWPISYKISSRIYKLKCWGGLTSLTYFVGAEDLEDLGPSL